jgi:hypothetical protein
MGAWFSRGKRDHFKSPSELQEELEQIDVKMAALESREASLERQRRRLVLLVLVLALIVFAFHSIRWYWIYYPPLVDGLAAYTTLILPNLACFVSYEVFFFFFFFFFFSAWPRHDLFLSFFFPVFIFCVESSMLFIDFSLAACGVSATS